MGVVVKTLSLPVELWELLDVAAARESRSRSGMAALLLEGALDAARGSVRDAPVRGRPGGRGGVVEGSEASDVG